MGVWSTGLVQMAKAMRALPVNDTENMSRMRVNRRKHCSVTSENLANAKCFIDKLFSFHKEQFRLIYKREEQSHQDSFR
jgi:hypothetical protein